MDQGWIKLHRQLTEWEWYDNSEALHLFVHLLLSANHRDNNWQGRVIKRGECITSIGKISAITGISQQSIRTLLKKLEKSGEIVVKSTNKYTHITLCKYDTYQDSDGETNKQTNKQLTNNQQTTNKQLTTNKNDNNDNNVNNEKKGYTSTHFFKDLLTLGIDEQLASDVIEHRKKTKGIFSKRAFNGLFGELEKFALGEKKPVADALTYLVEQTSWKTFTYEFYKNKNNHFTKNGNGKQKSSEIGYTPIKQFTGMVS